MPSWLPATPPQITQLQQLLSKGKPTKTNFPDEFGGICQPCSRYNPCNPTLFTCSVSFYLKVK
ncbi:MAG: hypothetical protein ACKOEO_16170 [Planctomycetaceae bacterium]